ncbi:hypothetical protein KAJ27_16905 [bacterium]|nr:hypothetical protein [bacterium]
MVKKSIDIKPNVHNSNGGMVINVASFTSAKLLFSGIWRSIVFGPMLLLPLVMGWYLYQSLENPANSIPWYFIIIISLPIIIIGWAWGTSPIRCFRAMSKKIYLRAGPDGISFRYPGSGTVYSLGFSCDTTIHELYWSEIRTWYPYDYKIGKFIYNRTIIFEGTEDWKFEIPMIFFEETRDEIIDNITYSCEMKHIRAEKNYDNKG